MTRLGLVALFSSLLVSVTPVTMPAASGVVTSTSGTTITKTYSYTNATESLTIPDNVTSITITLDGAQGGRGGFDGAGRPLVGSFFGRVTGTFNVTPGQIITVGIGKGGADSSVAGSCSSGVNAFSGDTRDAVGGTNPLGGYAGGRGGSPGWQGCSGYGGAGGAASVILIGTSIGDGSVATIVAGGSAGSGGSGQFAQTIGGPPNSTFTARDDTTSTSGQNGLYTAFSCRNGVVGGTILTSDGRCDGGGGAAGGGGAQGGKQGSIQYGAGIGSSPEWFGLGGYPGSNSTSGISELNATYIFASSNNGNGSAVISYTSGVPSAPTGVSGSPADSSVNLVWTAPSTTGSSAISGYTVQRSVSPYSSWTTASMCTGTSTSCTITGLTNGTAYKFQVLATNSSGNSAYSAASLAITPEGPPGAPTISSVTGGDGSLEVTFTAGTSTLAITNYEYSINAGSSWVSAADATSPITISGLVNGTTYSVLLRGVSASGSGTASSPVSGTPSALPGAPTITAVTGGGDGTSLNVTFVAGYSGGSTISDYEYGISPGENTNSFGSYVSISGTTSPFTISGLTSGATYTVRLRAKNTAGYSSASAFVPGVTLAAPSAPVITDITAGDSRLVITYTEYDSTTNGGSAISKVEYSVDNGTNWIDAGTLTNPFTISGLTNGIVYQAIFRATNAIGTSPSSTLYSGTPRTTPSAPNGIIVSQGPTSAIVSWTAPSSNGGSAVTGYTATAYSASTGGSISGTACTTSALTCTITGLTNGTTYYVSVLATNIAGSGPATSPRVSVIPAALPGAPTISTITAASARLSVNFTAGSADSNAPITSYQYTLDNGSNWVNVSGTSSPISILGLTNGTIYTVKIRAVTTIGNGADSNAVSGTPFTVPNAISNSTVTYTSSSGSVTLTWGAPNNNGSSISNYYVELFSNSTGGISRGTCSTSGSLSCTISSLTNGTTYFATLQSQNSAGYSERSAPRLAVQAGTTSTVSLSISTLTSVYGQSITETATVTTGATGTVNFTVNGASITGCSAVVIASDIATCTTTELPVGTNTLVASYSGNSTYGSSTSSSTSLVVSKNNQTISFTDIPDKIFGGSTFSLVASASSGNTVAYSSNTTSRCMVNSSGVVTIVAAGTCSIAVSQAGNSTYNPATTVTKSFTIAAKSLTISGTTVASKVYNGTTTPGAVTVGTISGLIGSDTMTVTAVVANYALATVGTYTPVVTYTLVAGSVGSISNYSVDTQTISAVISQASQTLTSTFRTASLRVGDTEVVMTTYVTASSGLSPTFVSLTSSVCSISGMALTLLATGTCNITASQSGNVNYAAALDVSDSMTVLAAIVITPPSSGGGGGESAPTPAPFVPTPAPVVPTPAVVIQKIRNLIVALNGTIATLSWTPISVASIVVGKASDGTTITLNAPANASSIEVSNLEPGFAYSATVTPDAAVDSSSADTVTFALAPAAPSNLQVQQSSGNLVMKWSGAKGSAQYRVAIVVPGKPIETIVTTITEVSVPAIPGTSYTFSVIAIGDAQLTSPVSEVVAKVPEVVKPVTPEPEKPVVVNRVVTSKQKVYFKLSSAVLDSASKSALRALATKAMKIGKSFKVSIDGFTQPTKVDPNFQKLSLDRAKAAATYIRGLGIKGVFVVKGAGQAPRNIPKSRYAEVTIVVVSK